MNINIDKYEKSVINNLNIDNINKIIVFLKKNNCNYIEELIEDYLDIFNFEYNEFIEKFNKLNKKYNNELINSISEDMNIIEEFYTI